MNCEQTLQQLSRYLDRELDDGSSSELARHLAECRPCFSLAEFERHLRAMVRRSCGCEQAPPSLQERVNKLLRLY